jgi:tetratricopeptide (TPR) repeat protein
MLLLHALMIAVMVVVSMGAPAQAQKAKPAARKPASVQPTPAQQLFYDGFEAYKAERFQDAIGLFEQGLRQVPTNALAAFYLGEAYAKTDNSAKAQEWYAASLAADPQSEVAAQARERVAAVPRGAAPPPPPTWNEGMIKYAQGVLGENRFYRGAKDGRWSAELEQALQAATSDFVFPTDASQEKREVGRKIVVDLYNNWYEYDLAARKASKHLSILSTLPPPGSYSFAERETGEYKHIVHKKQYLRQTGDEVGPRYSMPQ